MYVIDGKYSTARIMTNEVTIPKDEYEQILQFVNCHVFTEDSVIMPDYHWGAGCVIGFTSPLTEKVIPNIVGVDEGCNMLYCDFGLNMEWDMKKRAEIDALVRRLIPLGFKHHSKPMINMERHYPWSLASLAAEIFASRLNKKFNTNFRAPVYDMRWFELMCKRVGIKVDVAINSLGTLGGGNHFIEFSRSEKTGNIGVTLHAGSRGLGMKSAVYWQKVAKSNLKGRQNDISQNAIKEIKANYPQSEWDDRIKAVKLPPTPLGLEWLEGEDWFNYLMELNFNQIYAEQNLYVMMIEIFNALGIKLQRIVGKNTVHTIHNYVSPDDLIIRKGAVRSMKGERLLIPANMEDGILLCEGRSNPEWNNSACHGAGRLFGRKVMKQRKDIDVDDIQQRMHSKDIYTSGVPKDEVREAYKDIKFIEKVIGPTATIVDKLIPILNIKELD